MRAWVVAAALAVWATHAAAQDYRLEIAAAAELQSICRADAGQLWRVSLCGPLIVVDPNTRMAWASQRDSVGALISAVGGGWSGVLPPGAPVANTAAEWAGVRWIMVTGPLPEDAAALRVLVMHEAWHRVQDSLGLPMYDASAAHLETERGRYFMRLEMRALSTAMLSSGGARRTASRDALAFRLARFASFAEARGLEGSLDRNEGLAAYTGVKLGVADNPSLFAARTLNDYDAHQALARAYAYATGPAYGLLLDTYQTDWRLTLAAWAPADLLVSELGVRLLSTRDLQRRAERYGGPQIAQEERARAEARRQLIAELRQKFTEGPRLELPLRSMNMEFDPNQVTPIEGVGSYYGVLTIRDVWGELRATQGALLSSDFTSVVVAAPDVSGLAGPGWTLGLAPAYVLGPPTFSGVRTLIAAPPAEGY